MNNTVTVIVSAVLGFLGGLLAPWIKWKVEAWRLRDASRRSLISDWRNSIENADFYDERHLSSFGSSTTYSSLRSHMEPSVTSQFEARNTWYVGGGRGDDVRKQMLLDEVARLEKKWRIV